MHSRFRHADPIDSLPVQWLTRQCGIPGADRVAATQDVPRTALEAGNSAATILSQHRALATETEGKARCGIMPEQAMKVVRMRRASKG